MPDNATQPPFNGQIPLGEVRAATEVLSRSREHVQQLLDVDPRLRPAAIDLATATEPERGFYADEILIEML